MWIKARMISTRLLVNGYLLTNSICSTPLERYVARISEKI